MYKLLLWTPWDELQTGDLPENLKESLKALEDCFWECFIEPRKSGSIWNPDPYTRLKESFHSNGHKAIILAAYSGVGKSTLLRAALHNLGLLEDATILDMRKNVVPPGNERANWDEWLKTHRKDRHLTRKITTLLLRRIYDILCVEPCSQENSIETKESNEDEIKGHLRTILANYRKFYRNYPNRYVSLFRVISDYTDNGLSYEQDFLSDDNCYCNDMEIALFNLFSAHHSKNDASMDPVQELLEVLSVLLLCEKKDPVEARRVIAFDNIEHLIDGKSLFDQEIQDFLAIVNGSGNPDMGFIQRLNARYNPDGYGRSSMSQLTAGDDKSNVYSTRIPIVVAIREVSAVMQKKERADEIDIGSHSSYIELRNELDFAKIIQKRFDFLKKYKENLGLPSTFFEINPFDFIEKVLSDEYGVAEKLSQLHSYNKRRTLRGLIHACYGADGTILEPRKNSIKAYNRLLNERRKLHDDLLRGIYTNGQRQIVLRMWFDSISNNRRKGDYSHGLFQELRMVDSKGERGSARQILQYLSRSALKDEHPNECNSKATVSLHTMMSDVLINPIEFSSKAAIAKELKRIAEKNPEKIEDIAKKLDIMRQRDLKYGWIPLVLFRFNQSGPTNFTEIYDCLLNICKDQNYERDNGVTLQFGVKCTIAGRAFVAIAPSYEFFAARFFPSSKALFRYNPLSSTMRNELLSDVKDVKKKALDCIDDLFYHTKEFLTFGDHTYFNNLYSKPGSNDVHILYRPFDFDREVHKEGSEQLHITRIINSHIGYIDNYRLYAIHKLLSDITVQKFIQDKNIDLSKMIDLEKEEEWGAKEYASELINQKYYHMFDSDLRIAWGARQTLEIATQLSLDLLKIIQAYIEKLAWLTHSDKCKCKINGIAHYFVGGPYRDENSDWGNAKLGDKVLNRNLDAARKHPLKFERIIQQQDEEEV